VQVGSAFFIFIRYGNPMMKNSKFLLWMVAGIAFAGCASIRPLSPGSEGSASRSPERGTEAEIAALFDRWNLSLQTGDPSQVVAQYAAQSILLPTLSAKPRFTVAEKEDYFHHFLENQPTGEIIVRQIQVEADMAVDTGLYTFTFAKTGGQAKARYSFTYRRIDGEWRIISHHSSLLPE
jgi:uncharacterized protein (TIGR02246 family)